MNSILKKYNMTIHSQNKYKETILHHFLKYSFVIDHQSLLLLLKYIEDYV